MWPSYNKEKCVCLIKINPWCIKVPEVEEPPIHRFVFSLVHSSFFFVWLQNLLSSPSLWLRCFTDSEALCASVWHYIKGLCFLKGANTHVRPGCRPRLNLISHTLAQAHSNLPQFLSPPTVTHLLTSSWCLSLNVPRGDAIMVFRTR